MKPQMISNTGSQLLLGVSGWQCTTHMEDSRGVESQHVSHEYD